ncbi:hypothetical protein LSCM4_07168 [Leishmania orientalis]|uniref:Leucine-rich repeat protein (LRRP) n=1 Tax=Leishmania orientalis TaxID=2249476 RepID=A0A836KPL0_9TRYP|nr:hypothetical protein LSCM4_07168 [Leishmania orientalis]
MALRTADRVAVAALAETTSGWRERAVTVIPASVERWRTLTVAGWPGRTSPPVLSLRPPPAASCEARWASLPSAWVQKPRTPLAPCSLARLHSTLRYVNVSGCKALVDGSAIGSLEQLEYLHVPFTGIRDVRWVRRCRMLKVLDLANSPCCVGAVKAALEAELPQCLSELELLSSRPVDELQPRSP